ncbi:DUF397 domain-containing protein [Nocardia sp. CDC160]|uniref:DUF397 domain-containing protein n=1 Tax=Nocardia sp. CDC160 TaxID=3112166 RepID=UPI002DBCAB9A|nr:DUF397 domain-containing protein [Nocardia sp. CDC160]MEC3917923.1 DUF397 domain-containing protein [Nocardia sp. CDC160]
MSTDLSNAHWFKSTYSESGGQCVEVAFLANGKTAVRDSKNPTGPALAFAGAEWDSFTAAIRAGRI